MFSVKISVGVAVDDVSLITKNKQELQEGFNV